MTGFRIRTGYARSNQSYSVPTEIGGLKLCIKDTRLETLGPLRTLEFKSDSKKLADRIEELGLTQPSEYVDLAHRLIDESQSLLTRWACIMLLRLSIYQEKFPNGLMKEPIQYLIHSLRFGPKYSKYLKDVRANMFQYKLGAFNSRDFYLKFEKLSDVGFLPKPVKGGCDYDDILNERYLIHYDDTSEDFFDYPFRKVNSEELWIEQFDVILDNFLTKLTRPIIPPDYESMKNWITDSTSMSDPISSSVNRTLMRKLVQEDKLHELERPNSRFLRTVVNVGPANVRDAWQCDIPTLFKVKKVSYMMRELVSHHRFSAMATEAKCRRRRKKLKSDSFFVMTDIKKCGLTIPRYLFKVIADQLEKHGIECYQELRSLAESEVFCNGQSYRPERGIGLGNANEVITLIQCIICDIAVELDEVHDGIFFNDDGVYRVGISKFSLPKIVNLYRKYGIIMNIEKSYYSRYNIFCEDYISGEFDFSKTHLRYLSISTLYEQNFIHEQKKVFASIVRDLDIFSMGCIRKVNLLEFHRFENIVPLALGGWKNTSKGGINLLLDYITSPQKYLGVEERSFIPLMNKWITFIVENREEFMNIFYKQKRFRYRSEVKNPFNPTYQDLRNYDLEGIDDYLINNRFVSNENLYNDRGLKNAKPKLHYNYGKFIHGERKRFFMKFWMNKDNVHSIIRKDSIFLFTFLSFLRGEDDLCRNLAPPEFIGLGEKTFFGANCKKRKVIYSRAFSKGHETDTRSVNTLLSYRDKIPYPNLSIKNLSFLIESRGESYFTLKDGIHIIEMEVPKYYSLFFRDKRYFSTIYFNLYGRIPETWINHDFKNLDIDHLRISIYGVLFGGYAESLVQRIKTERENIIFNFIVKDKLIDSVEKLSIAVQLTKQLAGQLRIDENTFFHPNRINILEHDIDLINEFYPELAIDFLVEEDMFGSDYSDQYSDEELDPDCRIDMIDIYSNIQTY